MEDLIGDGFIPRRTFGRLEWCGDHRAAAYETCLRCGAPESYRHLLGSQVGNKGRRGVRRAVCRACYEALNLRDMFEALVLDHGGTAA